MRVLLTRPEPDAARTAAKLAVLGHEALLDPLLTLEPLTKPELPAGPFAALAATSANAVRIAGAKVTLDRLRSAPLYAVGGATAEAARAAGFANVVAADGDAAALARLLSEKLPAHARVLHLAGEERAQDLGALLAPSGILVTLLVLYRMRAASAFAAPTMAALTAGDIDAALHFSPRSAAAFAAIAERQGLVNAACRVRHYCLSHAVAAPLRSIGASAEIAARPNETDLLALLKL
jgi:uroporphyrinogen-III synthase